MSSAEQLMNASAWPVMVLAHNEERFIGPCLDSILAAEPECRFEIFVMANGCTDRTEEIVRQYAARRPEVHLVSIDLNDKCNAWNVFIHETVPQHCAREEFYFFMDGDARAVAGSFSAMARALRTHARAHAAAAVPASGANLVRDRGDILQGRRLVANLYALRGGFVERLREREVRMPLHLEGDDSLVGALAKWDLAPESNEFDHERIVPCADAAFEFEPLSPFRPADWLAYWRRAVRYGRRRYEFQLISRSLKSQGIAALPADITELYPQTDSLRLKWQGVYTLTNLVALLKMRGQRK